MACAKLKNWFMLPAIEQDRRANDALSASGGLTASEKVLAELCDKSFLKLRTYPNLFRKPSKELTDLLVVFGNDVIIFSDKSCGYPNTGDADLDWSRWYTFMRFLYDGRLCMSNNAA